MAELSSIVDIEIRTKRAVSESKKIVDNLGKIDKAQVKVKKSSKELEKSLDGSSKNIQKGSKAANDAIQKVGKSSEKSKKQVKDFGKEAKTAAGSLSKFPIGTAAIIAGVGAAAFGAIRKFSEFNQAVANLSAITGATGEDLNFLSNAAREMAKVTTLSASEVAKAFELVASAKPDLLSNAEALKSVTQQTILLAEAAGIDLVSAVNTVTKGLNIFGKGAESAAKFVDILAAGSKFGSSSIADTGAALLVAGGAAVDAGIGFRELNATLQVVAKGGFVASQAGTGLQAVFSRLTEEGFNFKKLGVDGVMAKVAAQLEAIIDPAARSAEKTRLFGLEHKKIAGALIRNIPLIAELNEKLDTNGIAQEQATIRTGTFEGSTKKLGSAFEELIIIFTSDTGIGNALSSFISLTADAVLGLGDFFKGIETVSEKMTRMKRESDKAAEGLESIGEENIQRQIAKLTKVVGFTEKGIERFRKQVLSSDADLSKAAQGALQRYIRGNADAEKEIANLEKALKSLQSPLREIEKETDNAAEAAKEFSQKTLSVISSIQEERDALKRTSLEQEIYIELKKAGVAATTAAGKAIVEKVELLNNEAEAIRLTSEADKLAKKQGIDSAKKLAKETLQSQRDIAKETRKQQEEFDERLLESRDGLADFFLDFAENGNSAFKNVFENFKNLLKRMVAEALASKVLEIFGFNVGGLSGSGGILSGVLSGGTSSGIGGGITSAITDIAGGFQSGGVSGGLGAIGDIGSNIGSSISGIGGSIRDALGFGTNVSAAGPTQGNVLGGSGFAGAAVNLGAGFIGAGLGNAAVDAFGGKEAQSSIGATIGGAVGSIFGPIGTGVGAFIGSLVDSLFGSGKGDPFSVFTSSLDLDKKSRRVKDNDAAGIISSPFGDFQFRTSRDLLGSQSDADQIFSIIDGLAGLEAQLAATLDNSQIQSVIAALSGDFNLKTRKGVDIEGFFKERFSKISSALGGTTSDFFDVPGFVHGGNHSGGLRIVGENGPELEATGPSRIFNSGQLGSMMSGNGDIVVALNTLSSEMSRIGKQGLMNTRAINKILQRWDQDGFPQERAA